MEVNLMGKLMDIKETQKNKKKYLVFYSDGNLYNVFVREGDKINYAEHLGKDIRIKVKVFEPRFIQTL